ncbi:hypothetical protein [Polyangium sp. y55x31]|uniref:hypothetical protein n=1 Tax=Polyangium sp. y55x31 TaxID=3042688 RepID=UPI002482C30A|nr:hypothetical protein [Polyangium sp. y55x31]MDI1478847.1 hypothetical protein [Polyangium sp. y55x31]
MRSLLFVAATSGIVALGGCLLSYDQGAYDEYAGLGAGGVGAGGAGASGGQPNGPGGMGGTGGTGGTGACHPAFCDGTSTCPGNTTCPPLAWSARWGAVDQQRVHAIASDGSRVALAGTYNGQSFEIGEEAPRTLPLASPDYDYEAYVTLLNGDGVATWAAPIALGVGYQPRTAYAVAFAGTDVVVAGSTAAKEGGIQEQDVFIRKFTPLDNNAIGEMGQPFKFGGDNLDEAVAVAAGSMGDFYVAGKISASSSKAVVCGSEQYPKNGMFVAGFDPAGACVWFVQVPGNVTPTALVYQKNAVRVVGHFEGTLAFSNTEFTAKQGTTDSFVLGFAPLSGAVSESKQISAGLGKAVRVMTAAVGVDGTMYVAGQLEGKTSVEPDLVEDGEYAAFVMPIGLENSWKRVFTGGPAIELGQAAGTSLALSADGSLYVAGTFRKVIDIAPDLASGTFERPEVNPFLARLDPTSGTVWWFDVYNGKSQTTFTKSFHVTTLQSDVVLAGSWNTDFNFSEDESKVLTAKGNGISDEDIIAAKITPKP